MSYAEYSYQGPKQSSMSLSNALIAAFAAILVILSIVSTVLIVIQ
jgi:hypothetical protein